MEKRCGVVVPLCCPPSSHPPSLKLVGVFVVVCLFASDELMLFGEKDTSAGIT